MGKYNLRQRKNAEDLIDKILQNSRKIKIEEQSESENNDEDDSFIENEPIIEFANAKNTHYINLLVKSIAEKFPTINEKELEKIVRGNAITVKDLLLEDYAIHNHLDELKLLGIDEEEMQKHEDVLREIYKKTRDEDPSLQKILQTQMTIQDRAKCLGLLEMLKVAEPCTTEFHDLRQDIIDIINKNTKENKVELEELEKDILDVSDDISLKEKILKLNTSKENRKRIYMKYLRFESMKPDDSDYSSLKTELGWYASLPYDTSLNINPNNLSISEFLSNIDTKMNTKLFGLEKVKEKLLILLNNSLSSSKARKNVAVCGPPGVGKTSVAKAFAEAAGLPFHIISLGGSKDSTSIFGSDNVWVGSGPGIIVKILSQMKCNNGVILFDEIDKLVDTPEAREVQSTLLHITDYAQNKMFRDKYLLDVPIDISNLWFFFSMNSTTFLDKALVDRMSIINIDDYNFEQKVKIVKYYSVPAELEELELNKTDIIFSDDQIKKIINNYSTSIRTAKNTVQYIVSKIHYIKTIKNNIVYPYTITDEMFDNVLKNYDKPKEYSYFN